MQSLEAFRAALEQGADDDALDLAAEDVRRDGGAAALATALRERIAHHENDGRPDLELTGLRFRLAGALEEVARGAPSREAGDAALEAAALLGQTLTDADAASRVMALAFRSAANDADLMTRALAAAGGVENAEALVARALKKKDIKDDAGLSASLRRAAQRLCEQRGDVDGAFFESLKAARKQPEEGLYVDEVFRLALEAKRDTEAAPFFQALADDEKFPERLRASLYNKLGATRERLADKAGALTAYQSSLFLRETKAARKNAIRLADELGVALPAAVDGAVSGPNSGPVSAPPAPAATAPATSPLPLPPDTPPYQPPQPALPPEMSAHSPVGFDEHPDVTPSYPPNRSFKSMQVTLEESDRVSRPVAVMPYADPSATEVEATDDLVVGEELRHPEHLPTRATTSTAPSDITTPRFPANMETASLEDQLPDPSLEQPPLGAGDALEDTDLLPGRPARAALPPLPLPPPFSLPPQPPIDDAPGAVDLLPHVAPPALSQGAAGHLADDALADERAAAERTAAERSAAERGATRNPPSDEPTRKTGTADILTAPPQEDSVSVSRPRPSPYAVPAGEITARDAVAPAPVTVQELPPLPLPPPTGASMEALDPIANALKVLESGDADACLAAARALDEYAPGDPRVLRLVAKALIEQAPTGALSEEAIALFSKRAEKHGDRAAQLALDVRRALPPDRVAAQVELWLAGARAAGQDAGRVLDLLRDPALADAPDGPAFLHVEKVLSATNDLEERDRLVLAALQVAGSPPKSDGTSDGKRVALTKKRIVILEQRGRTSEALPLWGELATRLVPKDVDVRRAARNAHAEKATPDERARLLGKLAELTAGDEKLEILHELLDVRLSVGDDAGAEVAARTILAQTSGDPRATEVLITLLERNPARLDELVELQRRAAAAAAAVFGRTTEAKEQLTRLARTLERAGKIDDAAEAIAQIARLAPDDKTVDAAIAALDGVRRHKEAVALLEEISTSVADGGWRARLLVRAADLARTRLSKRGKARELLDRALTVDADHTGALTMLAEVLQEMGDGQGALTALERLAAAAKDPRSKAGLEMRVARLLDEQLLKPDEAIARYQAAVAADPQLKEAWESLRTLARQRGDRGLLVRALIGMARLEQSGKERASLWRQVAKVERDERADVDAAERALRSALDADPEDFDALQQLITLLAHRLAPDLDVETVMENPPPAVLDAVREPFSRVADTQALPLALRRMDAAARAQGGDAEGAVARFQAVLEAHPADLTSLMQLARLLAGIGTRADERRLRVLEQLLVHHAYSLKPKQQVEVWGDVAALRAAAEDTAGARKAAKKVMALASSDELRGALSDRAVRAVALALDDTKDTEREPRNVIAALRLDAARTGVDAERSRLLERAADVALKELTDKVLARQLLEEAVLASPSAVSAREALLDLDVAGGDIQSVLTQLKDLARNETEPTRRAALYLRRFRLMKKHGMEADAMSKELTAALEHDPTSREILDTAEEWFHERSDADGLDRLYSAQLRTVSRDDVRARLSLLERLAHLRRYERRDLAAAVEALEAMSALDPEAIKPREDAARLYSELGLLKEAVNSWRSVLERDPIVPEAWRGLFSLYVRARQGDEAFAIASTMAALDLADDDIARVTRTLRPPFPRWPIPPKDGAAARKKVSHPLERTAIRAILDATAIRLLPSYARPLKEFGFRKKDALKESQIPTSVLLAVRTLAQLLGLPHPPQLYPGTLGTAEGVSPPFAVLPAADPGIIVTDEVLKGGMTPERAFALGRAAAWLPPHALLAASLEASQLRLIVEGLVCAFLGPKSLERPEMDVEKLAPELQRAVSYGNDTDAQRMKAELLPALRDYEHARAHLSAADFKAGVGYTADRYGFLVSTDLGAAVKAIKGGVVGSPSIGARLAIKELVLFSASSAYLSLRRDLGLALPEAAALPLLELD